MSGAGGGRLPCSPPAAPLLFFLKKKLKSPSNPLQGSVRGSKPSFLGAGCV